MPTRIDRGATRQRRQAAMRARSASISRHTRSQGAQCHAHPAGGAGSIPRGGHRGGGTADAATVVTVTLTVEALDPFSVTEAGEIEHVAVWGAPLQVSSTI